MRSNHRSALRVLLPLLALLALGVGVLQLATAGSPVSVATAADTAPAAERPTALQEIASPQRMASVPEPLAADARAAAQRINTLVPSARTSLVRDPLVAAHDLVIDIPASELVTPGTDRSLDAVVKEQDLSTTERRDAMFVAAANLGWRTRLAAAAAATENPAIARFQATVSDSAALDGKSEASKIAQNFLTGSFRGEAGRAIEPARRKLGTVSAALARQQMNANAKAIASVLPEGQLLDSAVDVVSADDDLGAIGVQLRMRVHDLAALERFYGDFLIGPTVGLIGDEDAVVDGVSVIVEDDSHRQLSSWRTERAVTGFDMASTSLTVPPQSTLRGDYTNLTGGPEAPTVRLHVAGPSTDSKGSTQPPQPPTGDNAPGSDPLTPTR